MVRLPPTPVRMCCTSTRVGIAAASQLARPDTMSPARPVACPSSAPEACGWPSTVSDSVRPLPTSTTSSVTLVRPSRVVLGGKGGVGHGRVGYNGAMQGQRQRWSV